MDVPATTAAMDGDRATGLRGPQPQEPFPAESEPDRWTLVGPAIDAESSPGRSASRGLASGEPVDDAFADAIVAELCHGGDE